MATIRGSNLGGVTYNWNFDRAEDFWADVLDETFSVENLGTEIRASGRNGLGVVKQLVLSVEGLTVTSASWTVNNMVALTAKGLNASIAQLDSDIGFPELLTSNDDIKLADGNDFVNSYDGNDLIHSGGGNDTILGGNGDDTIDGGSGRDSLFGGGGNDRIVSTALDIVDGGQGNDTLVLEWPTWSVSWNNQSNAAGIRFQRVGNQADSVNAVGFEWIEDQSGNIYRLQAFGASADAARGLDGTSPYSDLIFAGGGNDTITLLKDSYSIVSGGDGIDVLNLPQTYSDSRLTFVDDSFIKIGNTQIAGIESFRFQDKVLSNAEVFAAAKNFHNRA
jgi:Ca2+-binding RTX toxin-like protein